jgi:hypothetical protein
MDFDALVDQLRGLSTDTRVELLFAVLEVEEWRVIARRAAEYLEYVDAHAPH